MTTRLYHFERSNNMELSLIDTHCDTAYELLSRGESISRNTCHISLNLASSYRHYAQFFAIWSSKDQNDETAFRSFCKITDSFSRDIAEHQDQISLVKTSCDLDTAWEAKKVAAFIAVEDARLLAGDVQRLDELVNRGVKYITLLWGGKTCIGGAHDTNEGLTNFGKDVLCGCFERDIIPDISHASEKSTDDIIATSRKYGKPVIASHSNSYEVYSHSRNLRDRHFSAVSELGGIVGISLCRYHLTDNNSLSVSAEDVYRHIEHYMELGGENTVTLGCDLDGTDLPDGFSNISHLYLIANILASHNYPSTLISKLFCDNAYSFIKRNM